MFTMNQLEEKIVPMLAVTSKHRISLSNNNQTNPRKEKVWGMVYV